MVSFSDICNIHNEYRVESVSIPCSADASENDMILQKLTKESMEKMYVVIIATNQSISWWKSPSIRTIVF